MKFKSFILGLFGIIPFFLSGCKANSNGLMRTELDNGMVILSERFDTLPVVAVSVWARVGSAYEEKGEYGISHFLEHMLFRTGGMSKKQVSIQTAIEGAGGYLNGATGKEITYYFAVVPKAFGKEALNLLLDLFLNPTFDESGFREEKKVVIEEISRKDDDPGELLGDLVFEYVYADHPYGHTVLGDKETINNMKLDSLRRYYRTYYHPGNMVVSIVGDFDQQNVIEELKERFGRFRRDKTLTPKPVGAKRKKELRRKTIEKSVNQLYFALGFPGPAVKEEEHLYLDILAVILGEGASSRLVKRLKEKEKLVNLISSQFYTQRLSGLFTIYAQFTPENLEKVETSIWEELERLKQEPIESRELEKAKKMISAYFYFQHEIFKDQATAHAYWECLDVRNYEKEYLRKIEKISSADIRKAALKYFDSENSTRVIIKPYE